MTPIEFMRNRSAPLRLVIFDCDGVIVDSEPISARVVAAELTVLGWPMTAAEAEHRFVGMTLDDMVPLIEARVGHSVPPAWRQALTGRLVVALRAEARAVPGAVEAIHAVSACGIAWRIASNSSHAEMSAKFARLGIAELVAGRLHSHDDVARGKPAPDLFRAAAAAQGVAAANCVVIEDSVAGARAAAAAGMDCLGYAPRGDGQALRGAGAVPFRSMFEIPALIAAALRSAA
jgi:HAD superfamily hydrolase (TIGR01509 family)